MYLFSDDIEVDKFRKLPVGFRFELCERLCRLVCQYTCGESDIATLWHKASIISFVLT